MCPPRLILILLAQAVDQDSDGSEVLLSCTLAQPLQTKKHATSQAQMHREKPEEDQQTCWVKSGL